MRAKISIKKVKHTSQLFHQVLNGMSDREARRVARQFSIPISKYKADTIQNIVSYFVFNNVDLNIQVTTK